jgi:hypothetical protein
MYRRVLLLLFRIIRSQIKESGKPKVHEVIFGKERAFGVDIHETLEDCLVDKLALFSPLKISTARMRLRRALALVVLGK